VTAEILKTLTKKYKWENDAQKAVPGGNCHKKKKKKTLGEEEQSGTALRRVSPVARKGETKKSEST